MTKKLYIALIVLMSISLIGIAGLQVYWITESINVKRDQFSQLIMQSLKSVSNDLETIDKVNFVGRYKMSRSGKIVDKKTREQLITGVETDENKSISDRKEIMADADFSSVEFIVSQHNSSKEPVFSIKNKTKNREDLTLESEVLNSLSANDSVSTFLLALLEQKYEELAPKMPIHKRVNKKFLEHLLKVSFSQNNIKTRFEYAIMSKGLITPVYSRRFRQTGKEYIVPLFANKDGEATYHIYVQFPNERDYVLSTMWLMLLVSVVFTLVIVLTYAGALYLIFKHRRISEVKTDFINNMTHELKTPIATISLATDAMRNPKVLGDEKRILHYANVIKDENGRMNQQIENVLQISRLDKNTLQLDKEESSLNELVEDAINHILIIVEDKGGSVDFDFDAKDDLVNIDTLHFENIIVNILDNANKYSVEKPEIFVKTYNDKEKIIVEISDKGMGISKASQKKIFEKFFRVSRGNVHNIKGQGLGLAYVKQIVDAHDGTISVRSQKGKGSTFTVTMPLV